MPTVVNGVGTWYYGKRRIHCLKQACSFCSRMAELESYDTTLYFVVFLVPVLPLAQKRVLQACPYCRKHRVVSLKKWEAGKQQAMDELLDRVIKEPDNRDTVLQAIALACSYQDEETLNKLATGLASHWLDDAAIQAQLGTAYAYFARRQEAEAAFRTSLALEDSPEVRRQLALTLLKEGRPDDALPYLRTILEDKVAEHAGLIYLLVEAYQAQGRHDKALEIADQRDAAFPDLAKNADINKQRKISERHRESGKKIASPHLAESSKTGYREGNWTTFVPRLIPPLLLVGALCWYFGAAFWLGQSRPVYLVNGWDQPYTVTIDGQPRTLAPASPTAMRVPEGDVSIEFTDAKIVMPPITCHIETPFFTRPFKSPTFVINPDQVAVLVREEVEYAAAPQNIGNGTPPQLLTGKPLHFLEGVDYEFKPFPDTVSVPKKGTVKKARISLAPDLSVEQRVAVAMQALNREQQAPYFKQLLTLNPDNWFVLEFVIRVLPGNEALDLLSAGLEARPLRVEWHRASQELLAKLHPEEDRRPRYQKLVAETKRDPNALYLLARIEEEDLDEADKLLHEAADANPPSAYAIHALAFDALVEGRFPEAVELAEKAKHLDPHNITIRLGYQQTLLAARKWDELTRELTAAPDKPGLKVLTLEQLAQVYGLKGDEKRAESTIQQIVKQYGSATDGRERQTLQATEEAKLCCCRKDVPGYLKQAAISGKPSFFPKLLQGELAEAARFIDPDDAIGQRALLYLAALKAKDQKLADSQWQPLLAALAQGGGHLRALGEMLAGRRPIQVDFIRRSHIQPAQKRVLLIVVTKRHPDAAGGLFPLARMLDFSPDAGSLCLQKIAGR
jgi:tetratricopeptide (TPR) repeat protein